jgi:hypothetical protein
MTKQLDEIGRTGNRAPHDSTAKKQHVNDALLALQKLVSGRAEYGAPSHADWDGAAAALAAIESDEL